MSQQTRVYPYRLRAGSARPNPKIGAPDPENPLFLGFSVLRGGLRPWFRSRPSKPNQTKGQNEKFMNFALFCEFWCFSVGKTSTIHIELLFRNAPAKSSFLWFGLPGPPPEWSQTMVSEGARPWGRGRSGPVIPYPQNPGGRRFTP